jgi:cytochrome P450
MMAWVSDFDLRRPPEGFVDNPFPFYEVLRREAPVHRMPDGSVFLSRYAEVSALYRHPAASSDKTAEFAPKFGKTSLFEHHTTSLVFSDPPLHTRVRRLLMGALNQRAMQRMLPAVEHLVSRLIDVMIEKQDVDLVEDFAAAIPVDVIGNLLAVPHTDREPLRGWSLAILGALEPVPDAEVLDRGNAAVDEFSAYLLQLIAERRKHPLNPDEDVLTRLIQGEQDGERLTEKELVHNCIFLLNAGHETTTNLMGNGLVLLMRNPLAWARLQGQPELLSTAIEEMLRIESPLQLNNRRLLEGIHLGGESLEAGCLVTLGVGAANRDPEQFPRPDQFDVARKPNRHVGFGHGDHACAGMNVARLEARIALGGLLHRLRGLEMRDLPTRDPRIRFRGYSHIPAKVLL